MNNAPEITVLQLPKFKAEATELIGADGIDSLAVYLIDHPDAGDVVPGSGWSPEIAMGGEGGRQDHLPVCGEGCASLPDPMLRQERQDGSDCR